MVLFVFFDFSQSSDESTCCDDDFTWVRNTKENNQDKSSNIQSSYTSLPQTVLTEPSPMIPSQCGKSNRPYSLDRRRSHMRNRQERDSKSRSAHSLQESSASNEINEESRNVCQKNVNNGNKRNGKERHHKHQHVGGNGNVASQHHRSNQPQVFWERPFFPHWEPIPSHCKNYHSISNRDIVSAPDDRIRREDARMRRDFTRMHHDYYRYDSDSVTNLNRQNSNSCSNPSLRGDYIPRPPSHAYNDDVCCTRYYKKPKPVKNYCPCGCKAPPTLPTPAWTPNCTQVRFVLDYIFYISFRL